MAHAWFQLKAVALHILNTLLKDIAMHINENDVVLLDYGSGGMASHRLITGLFFKYFGNDSLAEMNDAAILDINGPLAMSTDSYTVDPVEFPGGNIGSLAVHGTVNDVAMMGAKPEFLSCACILEEGLSMLLLERIVASMAEAAQKAGVRIVTGDTKVVPKGAADKIFINTTGIGRVIKTSPPSGNKARPGDAILVSGTMGDHGLTILSCRESLALSTELKSDSAALNHMALELVQQFDIHVLRDPTRGGLATTLNEISLQSSVMCEISENIIPVKDLVRDACSVLGLDPLYLANEGKLICIVPEEQADAALAMMKQFPEGQGACKIGQILASENAAKSGRVILRTRLGGKRLLNMLEGEQLPRIC